MDKVYSPKNIEKKIYDSWIDNDCFKARESKSNYSIVLPPPNVTGTLHMGHASLKPSSIVNLFLSQSADDPSLFV